MIQAVPSKFGPDSYSIQESSDGSQTSVEAYTNEGLLLWQATIFSKLAGSVVPDAYGGLLFTMACDPNDPFYSPMVIANLDGATGNFMWQRPLPSGPFCLPGVPRMAVRADGDVAIAMPLQISPALIVVDGLTGAEILRPTIPPSTLQSQLGSVSSDGFSPVGPPMIDPEGRIRVGYTVRQIQSGQPTTSALSLLTISPDGAASVTPLSTSPDGHLWPGQVIPDGQGGLLATWVSQPLSGTTTQPYQAAHLSTGGGIASFSMPLAPETPLDDPQSNLPLPLSIALGESPNTAFVTYGGDLVAFTLTNGSPVWSYSAAQKVTIMTSEVSGGLTAKVGNSAGNETVVRFDANGSPSTADWSGGHLTYWAGTTWVGAAATEALSVRVADGLDVSTTGWASPDQRGTGRAVQNLYATSASKSEPRQGIIADVLTKIKVALEGSAFPQCKSWLTPTSVPLLQAILDNNTFGHATLSDDSVAAFVGLLNPDETPVGVPQDFAVTVNDQGAFFNVFDSRGRTFLVGRRRYTPNTLRARLETLVHETAHLVRASGFQSDFGIEQAGRSNSDLVDKNCRALIEGIQ